MQQLQYRFFHTDEFELTVLTADTSINISNFVSQFIMSACAITLNFTEFNCCLGTLRTSVRKTDFFCPVIDFFYWTLISNRRRKRDHAMSLTFGVKA